MISSVQCVDVASVDPQDFFTNYVSKRVPVVLKGLTSSLGIYDTWTNTYLKQKAGESRITAERRHGADEAFGKGKETLENVTFGEFLSKIEDSELGWQYYLTSQEPEEVQGEEQPLCSAPMNALLEDLAKDDILPPKFLDNLVLSTVNMWMGRTPSSSKWSTTGLHHDFHDNVYFLLRGKKRFNLVSPDEASKCQTRGKISKVHFNGRIEYAKLGSVRPDGAPKLIADQEDLEQEIARLEILAEGGDEEAADKLGELELKMEDLMEKLLDEEVRYEEVTEPLSFCKISAATAEKVYGAKRHVCELNPGDALFLPSGWFHEVESLSSDGAVCEREDKPGHLAVNLWFHPPDDLANFENPYSSGYWRRHSADARIAHLKQQIQSRSHGVKRQGSEMQESPEVKRSKK
jgi:hypothetical protein